MKMDIKIDYREKRRANKAEEFYKNKGHEAEIVTLNTGDYVFNDKVAFEYKTYPDLFTSIMNGLVFDEAHRQSEVYPWHYVIIVGNDKDRKNALYKLYIMGIKFSIKQYYGAMASLNTFTNVIYAKNTPHSFKIMECQAGKCLDGKIRVRTPNVKTKNPAFNLLMFLPDIREHRAKLLVDELNLNNYDDLKRITYNDLINIKGIGDITAKNILSELNNYGLQ